MICLSKSEFLVLFCFCVHELLYSYSNLMWKKDCYCSPDQKQTQKQHMEWSDNLLWNAWRIGTDLTGLLEQGFEKYPFINSSKHWYQMHLFLSHYLPCPSILFISPLGSQHRQALLSLLPGNKDGQQGNHSESKDDVLISFFFLQSPTTERVHRVCKSPDQQWQGSKWTCFIKDKTWVCKYWIIICFY